MAGRRSDGQRVAVVRAVVAATALALPLWLGSCAPTPPAPAPSSPAPLVEAGPGPVGVPVPADPAPRPQPQDPPPPQSAAIPEALETQAQAPATSTGTEPGGTSVPGPGTPEVTASQSPAPSAPPPSGRAAAVQAVTAYYVLLDDGGTNGVRFGCNDSLVGVALASPAAEEPLPAAVGALLEAPTEAGLSKPARETYNALTNSDLKFLSGSFDGTTVTVYLAGTLRLGGVCDIPRVEAQLTQTAVAAVGAIRAEIYVNGSGLAEALRLD
ncbi:hypothetical protein QF038_004364 [Pseudarthrobacter sp. W1I19]|uniref:hypothetical protein n=1 Tax=Pseudarthrobacter sp. W1I19 TaxID=3042288 RepID=UPI00278992A5|nr:hypothetical protein [Pseudarthrobacter sp. W1I19]MDQ0925856.1 hypothetical protein [Pseudarthrobacter sp. W1I19]